MNRHTHRQLRLWPWRACLATTLVAVLTLPAVTVAQESTPPLRNATAFEYPTYPGWIFTPSLATGGTWDDNLLLADSNDLVLRDYATPVHRRCGWTTGAVEPLWSSELCQLVPDVSRHERAQ